VLRGSDLVLTGPLGHIRFLFRASAYFCICDDEEGWVVTLRTAMLDALPR
jgi:hypothetical protein